MSENCPQTHRCKANAPGWLEGSHPTVEQGEVTRKVCFTWNGTCCSWSSDIHVLNCGKFYVYKLVPPDSWQSRYCGDHGKWASSNACKAIQGSLRFWIPRHGFRIPTFSGLLDSVSCNPDSKSRDSGFPYMEWWADRTVWLVRMVELWSWDFRSDVSKFTLVHTPKCNRVYLTGSYRKKIAHQLDEGSNASYNLWPFKNIKPVQLKRRQEEVGERTLDLYPW